MAGLAGFENWSSITAPGNSLTSCLAFSIAPFIPLSAGVSTSSAPKAPRSFLRSSDMDSGMVTMSFRPSAAATKASPTPVLPDVGSTMVPPGGSLPFCRASRIMDTAILSFTEAIGLKDSSFTSTSAPACGASLRSLTTGVPPIVCSIPSKILVCIPCLLVEIHRLLAAIALQRTKKAHLDRVGFCTLRNSVFRRSATSQCVPHPPDSVGHNRYRRLLR